MGDGEGPHPNFKPVSKTLRREFESAKSILDTCDCGVDLGPPLMVPENGGQRPGNAVTPKNLLHPSEIFQVALIPRGFKLREKAASHVMGYNALK